MKTERNILVPSIIATLLLILGTFPISDYNYYILLRWIICAVAIFIAFVSYESEKIYWAWTLGVIALIFNPIFPIGLAKETWIVIDLLAAVVFGITILLFRRKKKEAGQKRLFKKLGKLKKCPFCAEHIQNEAIKCRYCGERLDDKTESKEIEKNNASAKIKKVKRVKEKSNKKKWNLLGGIRYINEKGSPVNPISSALNHEKALNNRPIKEADAVSYCTKCHAQYREGYIVCSDCEILLENF